MSLYMDIHKNLDATLEDVQAAHERDLEIQDEFGVDYKQFWVDEETGTVFCLFEGPSKAAGTEVHEETHGLVADECYEVRSGDEH